LNLAFAASDALIIAEPAIFLLCLALLPLIRCPPPERLCLSLPEAVILTRFFNPLWVFCLGIRCIRKKRPTNNQDTQSGQFTLLVPCGQEVARKSAKKDNPRRGCPLHTTTFQPQRSQSTPAASTVPDISRKSQDFRSYAPTNHFGTTSIVRRLPVIFAGLSTLARSSRASLMWSSMA